MGTVFKAFDPSIDRYVALKITNEENPDRIRRLRQEAKMAGKLRHPGIVSIFDAGEIEGVHFIVMEHVEGLPLHQAVVQEGLRRKMELLQKTASAVGHAHSQGVVHRDLKPSNVLVTPEGEPVVVDLGLAKAADGGTRLTGSGELVGTPAYMSPEQVEGKGSSVGPRTDVYALGVMMYELCARRLPFSGSSVAEIYPRILEGKVEPLRRFVPEIPLELETICGKAMASSPAGRYPDAGAMADDLGRWLRGEEVRARAERAPTKVVRWIRRNWVASLVIFFGLACAGFYAGSRLTEPTRRMKALVKEADALIQGIERASPGTDKTLLTARLLTTLAELQALADKGVRVPGIRAKLGMLHLRCGDFPAAQREYRAAMSEDPNDAAVVFGLGESCDQLGNSEEAIPLFEKAVALDPAHPKAWEALGRRWTLSFLEKRGSLREYEHALSVFSRGIDLKPGEPLRSLLHGHRARIYEAVFLNYSDDPSKHDWLAKAEEDLRQALQGESTKWWSSLGRVLGTRGMVFHGDREIERAHRYYDEAVKAYDKAEALGTLDETDHAHRGRFLKRLKQTE